jgi:hypothetical protein
MFQASLVCPYPRILGFVKSHIRSSSCCAGRRLLIVSNLNSWPPNKIGVATMVYIQYTTLGLSPHSFVKAFPQGQKAMQAFFLLCLDVISMPMLCPVLFQGI